MKKILVIEDEPPVRANILELLEAEDYDAVGAENGFIGALWAQQHLPDLIICDVMMPEINGHEVLSALRQEPATETIPFIFLTAMADKADIRHGIELGADDYLTKPFTRAELLGAITSRFAKQEKLTKQYSSEHERAEALQQQLDQLQQNANAKEQLLKQFHQELQTAVPKLNMVINMLKNLKTEAQRDRAVKILQEACTNEIALLNQMPNVEEFLTPESATLLREFNLVDNQTN